MSPKIAASLGKTAASMAVLLLFAACAPETATNTVNTRNTPSLAFVPGERQIDLTRGTWAAQTIMPPPGLVTVQQGDLIGRTVNDSAGTPFATVDYLLVEPDTGNARYAITSDNYVGNYLAMPLSALRITPSAVTVDATSETLKHMPRMSLSEIEQRYPQTTLNRPLLVPPAVAPAMLPGAMPPAQTTGTLPSVSPGMTESLQLVHQGSAVGWPVVDSTGQPVGTVSEVAVAPTTGEARYAIISGPAFGNGYSIAVPASSLQTSGNKVILSAPLSTWMQQPRYLPAQVQARYGSAGVLN